MTLFMTPTPWNGNFHWFYISPTKIPISPCLCQVVLAVGGVWPGGDPADQPTDKTELLTASATAWQMAEPLPVVMQLLTNSILTVDNVVYLIGKLH